MNNFNEYVNKKLELDVLLNNLAKEAILPNTKRLFRTIEPFSNLDRINEELDNVDSARQIITKFERCPIYNKSDYLEILDYVSKGGLLSSLQLFETVYLYSSIKAIERLHNNVLLASVSCDFFSNCVKRFVINESFYYRLQNSIDEEGNILDGASDSLRKIRSRIKNLDDRIKSKINELVLAQGNFLADSVVVIRDDRYCLAIKSEYKNSYRGILHDVSSSNQTCYMEPLIVAQMSNEKDHLIQEEKEEVLKILKELTQVVLTNIADLESNYHILINLDIIFTKAILSMSYDGYRPSINSKGIVELIDAKHPLLKVKKVIPNNVSFGKDNFGIIITGPNTGGKTVLLKTIGLLSLMVKYGLLVPCSEESNINIFDQIFCDIGDDQSIEDNLSTFSSHMKKMVDIVDNVSSNSLVLFDEIGSGTDPLEGAQIGISVLKYFLSQKVSFVVTTHYSELKAFAYSFDHVVNASMEFNHDTLKPTYHLIIGKSGSSNAYSIAKGLGLKEEILEDAINSSSKKNSSVGRMLESLERMQSEVENLKVELKEKVAKTDALQNKLDSKLANIEQIKERKIKDACDSANKKIEDAIAKANEILENVKNIQNNNLKLHEIIDVKKQIDSINTLSLSKSKKKARIQKELAVGDQVYIHDYEQYGIISRIRKNMTYDVSIGNISINVFKSDLEYVEKAINETQTHTSVIDKQLDTSKKISLTLDLRGKRYDEAKELLDKYIDDLVVNNFMQASIIHGFGTGAIRELVQTFCRKNKNIDSYRYGGEGEGGLGVTVITLKK